VIGVGRRIKEEPPTPKKDSAEDWQSCGIEKGGKRIRVVFVVRKYVRYGTCTDSAEDWPSCGIEKCESEFESSSS